MCGSESSGGAGRDRDREGTLGVSRQVGLGLWPVGARERDRENSKIPELKLRK